MIIVTGAYGFIGSCLVKFLNQQGITDIVAVDDFSKKNNEPNLADAKILQRVERDNLLDFIDKNYPSVAFIFHLGARTDTTEFDWKILEKLNLTYSQDVFLKCTKYCIPIIYASSAATYGNGEQGYSDRTLPQFLTPLNPYGKSKNDRSVVSKIVSSLKNERKVVIQGTGKNQRDYVYIHDLCLLLQSLLPLQYQGILNIATGGCNSCFLF